MVTTYSIKTWRCGNCRFWNGSKCDVSSSDRNSKGEKRTGRDFGCIRFTETQLRRVEKAL